jgi:hypothetical protein
MELTKTEFNEQIETWKLENAKQEKKTITPKKEEPVPLAENEWECDFCKKINKWKASDRKSSQCSKCLKRNENIYSMIKMA